MIKNIGNCKIIVFLVIQVVGNCFSNQLIYAQSKTGILIREGVVFDKQKNEIYVINQDQKLEVISAKTGKSLWQIDNKIEPLAFIDRKLVGRIENSQTGNKLLFAKVDSRKKGRELTQDSLYLPEQSNVGFESEPTKLVMSQPTVINGDVFISWEYANYRPLQGIFRKDSILHTPDNTHLSGIIKIESSSGKPTLIQKGQFQERSAKSISLDQADKIPNVEGQQYWSTDRNNVLVSTKFADDSIFNKYIWKIYDRNGMKIGELFDYRSFTPFVVDGNMIIYGVGPYRLRQGNEIMENPLQITAVDLHSGKKLWSKQIFESANRKTAPP